jgi:signal transduction histidine kinase
MSTTIDDFRNFFKPNREKILFSPRQAIGDALSIVETTLGSDNIAVHLEIEMDAMVFGFPNEYAQVLLNLIGNAKDILLERDVAPALIKIRLATENGQVKVSIADNGGGVPEEIMAKIFDPYFTTRARGTGIGLYMSKMIIENNMNGVIRVRNTEYGAEFEIIVPMVENEG